MDEIMKQRQSIDEIDDQIMSLLDQRFIHTTTIGNLKSQSKKEVLDQNREQEILNKMSIYSHFPQIKAIYITIMNESKKLQRK